MTAVKICGIRDREALDAAVAAGADFVGFVFYPKSPRNITIADAAALVGGMPRSARAVGLFVNPTDEELKEVLDAVPLDFLQLHGTESPQRVRQIRASFSLPVIKAVSVSSTADIANAKAYERVASWLLFDAKPAALPGGTGEVFDWNILKDYTHAKPWMLAGGLNAQNVQDALAILAPDAVDVSSGVETAPGLKSPAKIEEFIETVYDTR